MLTFNTTYEIDPAMSKGPTFGQRLKELRKAAGLTQRELAEQVASRLKGGFDFTYLSKIENDRTPPPSAAAIIQLAECIRLAGVIEANTDELIALAGKVPPDLGDTLKESEGARTFYRSAMNASMTEEDWKKALWDLKRRKRKGREDSKD